MSNIMNQFNNYADDDLLDTETALNNILGLNMTGGGEGKCELQDGGEGKCELQDGGLYNDEAEEEEPTDEEIRKNLMVLLTCSRKI